MMMIIFLPRLLSPHSAWYKKNSDNQYFLIISLQQNFYAHSIKLHKFTFQDVRVENASESFLLEPFLIRQNTYVV